MTELVTHTKDVVVLARNSHEMAEAQQRLVTWVDQKATLEHNRLQEAEDNLAHAKKMKLRLGGWQNQVRLAKKRVLYYEKMKGALVEGYCIVPNFPVDVIAVRTDQKNPPKAVRSNPYHTPRLPDIKEKELPEGDGRYVNPQPFQDGKTTQTTNEDGVTRTTHLAWASDFDEEIEFPFRFVKPQVFEDLDRAMKLKIFDRIGVLPARTKGDPMVIGQIIRKEGYTEHVVSFLVTWWVDTRDL